MTLREAARGSYLETVPQLFFKFVIAPPDFPPNSSKIHPKFGANPPKTFLNPPGIPPNPSQNRPKIDQKPSWSPFWINALQKLDFERPRNGQEAPKSDQKTPQSAPTPSQMEPKTVPNPFLEHFFGSYFPIRNLHGFLMDFCLIFASSNP